MNFSHFTSRIKQLEKLELGGLASQFKLVPQIRLHYSDEMIRKNNPKKAAVLALFYPDTNHQTRFILTQRAQYNGTHSSQISFPGGKQDPNDDTLKQTALRETYEEIGISRNTIEIVKELSNTYIPPSNFMVTPFIGVTHKTPHFKPNYEVDSILEICVDDLLNDLNISTVKMTTSYMEAIDVPCFKFNSEIVWGATAMMLSEIKDLLHGIH